ncbi:SET domain-containing protein SmydA-8-like [Hetaerina americana]|uniref:SET domain-containing protein SmydA-8-like n=1 Tax=Hetaerina americana TaxID=62018 RepID=UPI003A7F300A
MALCEFCGAEEAKTKCTQCCIASYCSKEHQEKHREIHEKTCHPYIIKQSNVLGRYLAASRGVTRGEVLLREKPVALGPQPGSPPVCLGCSNRVAGDLRSCPACRVAPLCGTASCAGHEAHECAALANLTSKRPAAMIVLPSQAVLPLRCFLLQWTNPQQWPAIMALEGHLEERRGTSIWRSVDEGIVRVLCQLGLISAEDREVLQKICAVLDVNSFEVRGPEGEPLRALYPTAALLAHDCAPSSGIAHEPGSTALVIRAAIDLASGDPITHNYAGALVATLERRASLRRGKYFECGCGRCRDPRELGTDLSSLRCPACGEGPVVPEAPLNPASDWRCQGCGHGVSGALAAATHSVGRTTLLQCDREDAEGMERLLLRLKRSFYPGNAVLLEVGQVLAGLYSEESLLWEVSNRPLYALLRRWELCHELLDTLSKLEPGISRTKGVCMHEMAVSALALSSRCVEREGCDPEEIRAIIQKAETLLLQSIANLIYEPDGSPERKLVYSAFNSLHKCKYLISRLPTSK